MISLPEILVSVGLAGTLAGFVLGFLGAGGPVTGLPFFLYVVGLAPHLALGTNALGIFFIAAGLGLYRVRQREVWVVPALAFALPGLVGIFLGAQLGLQYPGSGLVFLLGFVLAAISVWMYYLSTKLGDERRASPATQPGRMPGIWRMLLSAPVAVTIGLVSGFFGVGGGFLIVPAFILLYKVDLVRAAASSLIPIAAFSGVVGVDYSLAGKVDFELSVVMLVLGLVGGFLGIWVGKRLSKRHLYRVFAAFLAILGIYIVIG